MTEQQSRRSFYAIQFFVMAVIVVGWWSGSGHHMVSAADKLIVLGRLFGLLATFSILLEVFLMSRVPFIERHFGLQEIMDLHRWNGYLLLGSISAHVVFLVLGYGEQTHAGWWAQFGAFNSSWADVYSATVGTLAFFCVTFLSLRIMRKTILYELWYVTHLAVYVAILLTFQHQINSGADFVGHPWLVAFWYLLYGVTFTALGYYRVLVPLYCTLRYQFTVEQVVQETPTIYSVYITGRNLQSYAFLAGQYATWRFLAPGLWYEAHPFSFSYQPGKPFLRLSFRAEGDFTRKLRNVQPGTHVLFGGARGAFTTERIQGDNVLLIAGGIGVAPYLAKIEPLLRAGKRVTLLYAVRDRDDVAFRHELAGLQRQGLRVRLFVSSEGQYIEADEMQPYLSAKPMAFICGPDSMSRAIAKALRRLGLPKDRIVSERFAF